MEKTIPLKRRGVVLAGYYGFGNAGDELILYALIKRFRKEEPDVEITVLSKNPRETAERFGVVSVDRWRPAAWFSPLFLASRFVLGGGGLLQESTGPWNYLYYVSLIAIAKAFGCRTEARSLGVDPIQGSWNRFLTRGVFNRWIDFISVRDDGSRQALIEAGVRVPIQREADPVFDLSLEPSTGKKQGIALALSPWKGRPDWAQDVARFCDRLQKQFAIPIDLLVLFPVQDEAFARAVARFSPAVRDVHVARNPLDLLSWIQSYQIIVGTRFHALVLAARGQLPFVGWGNQKKVSALCQEMGRPFWNSAENWNEERVFQPISELLQTQNKSVILGQELVDFPQ